MSRILVALFSLWIFPVNTTIDDHAIYISVLEISLPSNLDTGTMLIKTFSDDLQNALHHKDSSFKILEDPCNNLELISSYSIEHIQLKVQNRPIEFLLKDCNVVGDSHWLTYEFTTEVKIDGFVIESDWMTELFPTQSNIFKIKCEGKTYYERLSKEKTKALIMLD